jgi:hypothetical protein
MKHGMLEVITEEPLTENQIKVLQRLGKVIDLTYTRFLDLQKAEKQISEAQIETALERIRSRSMAMHNSEELQDVVNVVFNQLSQLDVTGCIVLAEPHCEGNRLTGLDVSNNSSLVMLNCARNQLTTLDISNNSGLKKIVLTDNPTLSEVRVWSLPFPPKGVEIDAKGSPNLDFIIERTN